MSTTAITVNTGNSTTPAVETVRTLRNFRSSADIENFYRFVNEHGLRREAKQILETIASALKAETKKQNRKKKSKKLQ
jgi:geranylgeranyl pyrophosphate synthase